MNYSKQRELIIDALRKTDTHPTAESVYRALKGDYPKLSLATVYRNLNQLCENGAIKKLNIPDSPDRFDGNIEPHYHLCCKMCKKVVDVKGTAGAWQSLLAPNSGHQIDGCDIMFFGVCASCTSGN